MKKKTVYIGGFPYRKCYLCSFTLHGKLQDIELYILFCIQTDCINDAVQVKRLPYLELYYAFVYNEQCYGCTLYRTK